MLAQGARWPAAALLVAGAVLATPAVADEAPEQTTVYLGFHIIDVRNVDMRNQSFFADYYVWMRFHTPSPERAKEIESKFEVMNGKLESKEEVDRKTLGDQTYICWRATGTFFFGANLRRYPFDSQSLELVFENANLEADSLVFADDTKSYERSKAPKQFWGVKAGVTIPQFRLNEVRRSQQISTYPTDFGDPSREQVESKYSRFVVSLQFQREYMSYVYKIVIPLLIIIAMAYLVFFIPAKELSTASTIAITALLTCMAFNIAVAQNMPEVGYLVVSDKFFIASYLLLFLTLAETVATYVLDDRGHGQAAERIDAISRVAFPVAVLGVFGYLLSQAV